MCWSARVTEDSKAQQKIYIQSSCWKICECFRDASVLGLHLRGNDRTFWPAGRLHTCVGAVVEKKLNETGILPHICLPIYGDIGVARMGEVASIVGTSQDVSRLNCTTKR